MDNCLFCKIANKEINSEIVYEDEYVIAFKDINPIAKVHVLVIPKKHIENINDLNNQNSEYALKCMFGIQEVAKIMNIYESGYRVISNVGKDARQEVYHLHFHVIGGETLSSH